MGTELTCPPPLSLSYSRVQWRLEQDEGAWTLRNHHSGQYLGIEGEARDGTPVVGLYEPFRWDIWPDEEDSSTFRCAAVMCCLGEGILIAIAVARICICM